jgi:hypothetical protein
LKLKIIYNNQIDKNIHGLMSCAGWLPEAAMPPELSGLLKSASAAALDCFLGTKTAI